MPGWPFPAEPPLPEDFNLSEFSLLNIAGGATFGLTVVNGNLTLDGPPLASLSTMSRLSAAGTAGDIQFVAGLPVVSLSADLRATGVIRASGDPLDIQTLAGNIVLSADLGIGGSGHSPWLPIRSALCKQPRSAAMSGCIRPVRFASDRSRPAMAART